MCPPEGCLEKTECAPTVGPYLILLQALWAFALQRDSWTSRLPASALCKTAECTRLAFQSIHFNSMTCDTLLLPPGCSKLILGRQFTKICQLIAYLKMVYLESLHFKLKLVTNICNSGGKITASHGKKRRQWQPTPVFLPGESQGRGSLVGCRLWGHTELDTTEAT